MKTKLQVIHTLTETLKFSFTKLPMAFRLGWVGFVIAAVIMVVGTIVTIGSVGGIEFFESLEYMDEEDFLYVLPEIIGLYLSFIGWVLLACLAFVPFAVVMKQIAAGTIEPPRGIGYFRFGGREVKFVLAGFILSILSWFVLSILMIPFFLTLGAAIFGGIPAEAWQSLGTNPELFGEAIEENVENGEFARSFGIGLLALFVGMILYIWFAVRACLFTTASAIESSIAPFGSFGLTGGNFWRLVGLFLLYFLVIMAMEMVLQIAISVVFGMGAVAIIPMFEDGASGGSIGVGILAGLIFVLVMIAYMFLRVVLELSLPAKIYASLTRDPSEDGSEDALVAQLSDEPR